MHKFSMLMHYLLMLHHSRFVLLWKTKKKEKVAEHALRSLNMFHFDFIWIYAHLIHTSDTSARGGTVAHECVCAGRNITY